MNLYLREEWRHVREGECPIKFTYQDHPIFPDSRQLRCAQKIHPMSLNTEAGYFLTGINSGLESFLAATHKEILQLQV